jgi:hypothetical protein
MIKLQNINFSHWNNLFHRRRSRATASVGPLPAKQRDAVSARPGGAQCCYFMQ